MPGAPLPGRPAGGAGGRGRGGGAKRPFAFPIRSARSTPDGSSPILRRVSRPSAGHAALGGALPKALWYKSVCISYTQVLLRGKPIVRECRYVGQPGDGQDLPRQRFRF